MTDRDRYLLDRYGITQLDFERILAAQGGGCGICGAKRRKNAPHQHVDHDHKTGAIRGILCKRCNERLLPAALDKVKVLRAAAEYLERAASAPYGYVPEGRKQSQPSRSDRWKNAPDWMKPAGQERNM